MIKQFLLILREEFLFSVESLLRLNAQQSIYAILLGKSLSPRQYVLACLWLLHPACPEQHRLGFNRWPVLKPVVVK